MSAADPYGPLPGRFARDRDAQESASSESARPGSAAHESAAGSITGSTGETAWSRLFEANLIQPDQTADRRQDAVVGQPLGRARFVTACQQMLALGAVLAVLTPAAAVVSLDVVHDAPGQQRMQQVAATGDESGEVPSGEVKASVHEVALTQDGPGIAGRPTADARKRAGAGGDTQQVLSTPQPVSGYASVGVTWSADQPAARSADGHAHESAGSFEVRTRTDGVWTDWESMDYHDEHAPDPGSVEDQQARPGTDAYVVGDVDDVQVRVTTEGAAPGGMDLAIVDPGEAASTVAERPAIDTGALARPGAAAAETTEVTDKPKIFSRAQWGADESIRHKSSLHYHEVHAGFVHHTVTANSYTRAQVPGIIRGIYAYHVKSRGWSDIGYNYLVDRFGRVWEGRYGGVDRPVVGAHTLGYNDDSFAMSALGNYDIAKPSSAMITAYQRLFAWKLSLHGVNAASKKQWVTKRNFAAINGHRDAGATACPGQYLYARLGDIRSGAKALQKSWDGRERQTDLDGDGTPDVLLRRKSDGLGVLQPIEADGLGEAVPTKLRLTGKSWYSIAGDWDRDGFNDVVWRERSTGDLYLVRGLGDGRFDEPTRLAKGFADVGMLAAVGDMTGDGYPDLMGQPKGRSMQIYPGAGADGLDTSYTAYSSIDGTRQVGVGRVGRDGAPDTLVETGNGMRLYPGNGPGGLMTPESTLDLDARWVLGVGDVDGDGRADLVVRPRRTGKLVLMPGTASGFGAQQHLGKGMGDYSRAG